uniref:Mismatch repair endonuclease PMS2 n=1 Tax=Oreochromis niloticus TaxID=8128 RepID=A0A669DX85_ORENI
RWQTMAKVLRSVITCHESSQVGTKLVFDHKGHLVQKTPHPRQQGTTVSLQQLFSTLPVRHKEFQRNIKKEYAKMIHVLQSYCIISTGVRITCSNQNGQGKRSTVLSTSGSQSMRDNIGAIFGPKQLQSLLPFQQVSPTENVIEEYGLKDADLPKQLFSITGFVSQGDHGVGRSTTDRQFYFINNRPCDPLKVTKLVNEVYHMYNRHQYPFVALNIAVASECVDVNVTPDKRQIFLQEEKLLLAILKTSLIAMYEGGVNKISLNYTPPPSTSKNTPLHVDPHISIIRFILFLCFFIDATSTSEPCRAVLSNKNKAEREEDTEPVILSPKSSLNLAGLKAAFSSHYSSSSGKSSKEKASGSGTTQKTLQSFFKDPVKTSSCNSSLKSPLKYTRQLDKCSSAGKSVLDGFRYQAMSCEDTDSQKDSAGSSCNIAEAKPDIQCSDLESSPPKVDKEESSTFSNAGEKQSSTVDAPVSLQRRTVHLQFSLAELGKKMRRLQDQQKQRAGEELLYRRFRAKINPGENHSAEEELKKEISKEMFKEMEIIGQFNLGFIITKLKSDLFMIDQHATDEKYNFEMLQQHTILQGQKLIVPQKLHLTAVSENVLIENIEIFRNNGFEFLIDEDAQVMERVKLVSLPTSKNWTFGPSDIEELIFMLSDSPGVMCRPSRVRQMFASRACRKSVMIGTALNVNEMKKLVVHMGEIEHPWNCPHGRPTMRHLANLDVISQD